MLPQATTRGRRGLSLLAAVGLLTSLFTIGAGSASADVVCQDCPNPSIATPLGAASVAVSAANVMTVDFAANDPSHTLVAALPFALPPGPPCRLTSASTVIPPGPPCFVRNSLTTAAGTVSIDTAPLAPGSLLFQFTGLVVISIHPPGPCRVSVTRTSTDTIVVFTPVI